MQVRAQGDGVLVTQPNLDALLALKQALYDPHGVLSSWNASYKEGACSGLWVGVKCAGGEVVTLQLPGRGLGGTIAQQIGELTNLRKLNLHTNAIEGQIPQSLASLPNLRALYLFDNQLSGAIPTLLGSSSPLQVVDLSKNQLNGTIPPSLPSSYLFLLDLSFNNLTGALPSSASMQLRYLILGNNFLTGSIPASIAESTNLIVIRLEQNRLGGTIPSQLGSLFSLQTLDLSNNDLNGSIPYALGSLASLIILKLAHNNFSGSLPTTFKQMRKLEYFDVASNRLSGGIPPEIAEMVSLSSLDLSQNAFNGSIPVDLAQLNLTAFNVSYNDLSGVIPSFSHAFNATSFLGNDDLCGFDAAHSCFFSSSPWPSTPVPHPGSTLAFHPPAEHRSRGMHTVRLILIVLCSCLASIALVGTVLFLLCYRTSCSEKASIAGTMDVPEDGTETAASGGTLVHFDGPVAFTADDLLCATAEVMGKSSYGTAYKTTMENGYVVVVKRLREGMIKSQAEFEAEVNCLGRIRHPNLVALRAYYWGPKDEKLLVFDFISGASLAAYLHAEGKEMELTWNARMNIAAGVARGLYHLHKQAGIDHGNLSSSNVLLDSDLNAGVADFGLASLMTAAATSNANATAAALGYRAPELARPQRKPTSKSDIYSFGILLLELLTGKLPSDPIPMPGGAVDLPHWVTCVVKEEWTSEVFDVELMKGDAAPSEEELVEVLQLALCCVASVPSSRPEMTELLHRLEDITSALQHQSS
ncbi:hypothetical protein O6H91_16G042000 [Diphasiastrum complanatum]|nr:hypothetical protein O6H91_16G042000 [Diphasiastrum complanatum]